MSIVRRLTTDFHIVRVCLDIIIIDGVVWGWVEGKGTSAVLNLFSVLKQNLRAFECEALLQALLELIEHDSKDDDQPGDHFFPEFLDAQQDESIGQDSNH